MNQRARCLKMRVCLCGAPLGDAHGNRKYCSQDCFDVGRKARDAARRPATGVRPHTYKPRAPRPPSAPSGKPRPMQLQQARRLITILTARPHRPTQYSDVCLWLPVKSSSKWRSVCGSWERGQRPTDAEGRDVVGMPRCVKCLATAAAARPT